MDQHQYIEFFVRHDTGPRDGSTPDGINQSVHIHRFAPAWPMLATGPSRDRQLQRDTAPVLSYLQLISEETNPMAASSMRLYHNAASPNSRRVRIFVAEKGLIMPLVPIDLGKGEQHSDAYLAINPRRVVPTLVLEDGTAIGEVLAIWRYLEEMYPTRPLLGATPKEKALVTMWERRAELEGFAVVMEGVRNAAPGLKGRAIAGPHDYEQIPALVERSKLRVANFLSDLDARLAGVPFVAGDQFSAADITALATIDFAAKALAMSALEEHRALTRWYEGISARPSINA
jgi:glutathione S-transferase